MKGLPIPIFALLAVTACVSSNPLPPLSAYHERAIRQLEAAERAHRQGDFDRAAQQWNKALILFDGIQDKPRRTTAALGLSKTYTSQGKQTEALQVLEEAERVYAMMPVEQSVQLQGRRALLLMNLKQEGAAAQALGSASDLCQRRCSDALALQTLQARLLLTQGQNEAALSEVLIGLKLQPPSSPKEALNKPGLAQEQANLLRLAALARLRLGQLQEAERDGQMALDLDRSLGEVSRVLMDLDLMADIASAQGLGSSAQGYRADAERARKALSGAMAVVKP